MVISQFERVLTSKEGTKPKSLKLEVGGVCSLQKREDTKAANRSNKAK